MTLVDADTGEIVEPSTGLAIPRPHEVTSPSELCESVEAALPSMDDPAVLLDGRAKVLAIEKYLALTTKVGKARMEATVRRIEIRVGEILGEPELGGDRGNQHTGGKLTAGNLPEIPKKERHQLRLLAAHRDVAEQVIADSDDTRPPSRRRVLDAIRDHLAQQKDENVDTRSSVKALALLGLTAQQIARDLDISPARVSQIARQDGIAVRGGAIARDKRGETLAELAAAGHSSHQIATELRISVQLVKKEAQRLGIEIPADEVLGRITIVDPARVIEQTVIDLEGAAMSLAVLPDDLSTIEIDPDALADWVTSLKQSISALNRFTNKLKEMAA